jgi:pimeloyl-ACP methyl ester carboxylesterase
MTIRTILICLLILTGNLAAQKPPYDKPPAVKPPYHRVRYEASVKPGELIFPVQYTVWIPAGVKTLRGVVVHQHGCGEGSCKSGQTGAFDLHWQALAKKHGCALLAPSYEQPQKADCQMWCDPRNGSDATFRKALADLGKRSGHPELAMVPWALWGHSGGGHWAGGMVMLHPKRVAAAWLRSGVPLFEVNPERKLIKPHALPKAALGVPMMCNPGTKEGVTVKDGRFAKVWPANETFFKTVRGRGGLIGVAVDPLAAHECGNQRYMAIPWLDVCLAARLPAKSGQPLKPMPTQKAWLAPLLGDEAVPSGKFSGNKTKAVWLPNAAIARAWMHYIRDTKIPDRTPPPAPTDLKLNGNVLTWNAVADLESGLAHFIIQRDGKTIATVPETPKNRFGRPIFQGLQYSDTPAAPLVPMSFKDTNAKPSARSNYRVIAVNTAGLRSK